MEKRDEKLIERLVEKNEELKKCMDEHLEFEKKLEKLNRKAHLTLEEEVEKKRIKKLKLAGRDEIEKILSKYR